MTDIDNTAEQKPLGWPTVIAATLAFAGFAYLIASTVLLWWANVVDNYIIPALFQH